MPSKTFRFIAGNRSSDAVVGVESNIELASAGEWQAQVQCRDSSRVWTGEIASKHIGSLKSQSNSLMSDDDWSRIVRWTLLGECDGTWPGLLEGVEIEATWDDDASIIGIYSSHEANMVVTLGEIKLKRDHKTKVTTSWDQWLLALGQQNRHVLRQQQLDSAELHTLEKQCEELVQAKKQYEQELLARCAALINEKKKKINELLGFEDGEAARAPDLRPEVLSTSIKTEADQEAGGQQTHQTTNADGEKHTAPAPAPAPGRPLSPIVKQESQADVPMASPSKRVRSPSPIEPETEEQQEKVGSDYSTTDDEGEGDD